VVDGVDLDKTGDFPLIGGVKDADRDPVFEERSWFGKGIAFEREGGLVFF
jgi:hypothetical protein